MTGSLAFWIAAALSLLTFAVHTFVGGVRVARPLLDAPDLPPASRWLNYYCWHITTVLLAFMAFGFAAAAMRADAFALGVFLTVLAPALSLLSVAVALRGRINPLRFPSTTLFALTAAAGASGVIMTLRGD